MGAGTTLGLVAALKNASDDELFSLMAALEPASRERITKNVRKAMDDCGDEIIRRWREVSADDSKDMLQRMHLFEGILRDITTEVIRPHGLVASVSLPTRITTELVYGGAARDLLTIAEDARARFARPGRAPFGVYQIALELLTLLVQGNEAASQHVGLFSFRKLLPLVHMDLEALASGGSAADVECLLMGMCSLNCIVAVSTEARSAACQNGSFLRALLQVIELSNSKTHLFMAAYGDMAIETLSHLAIPECEQAPRAVDAGAACRCCVCLGDIEVGEIVSSAWSCRICSQRLHKACAEQWLKTWRRCPYCRAMTLPEIEVKDLLMSTKLLALLESERAAADIPLAFSISLLIVHIASSHGQAELFEVLYKRGFLSQLLAALEAAESDSDWPEGSNAFPLVWKLAVTVEQFAKSCYKPELEGALRPLVRFLLSGKVAKGQDMWCIRAIQACLVDDGQVELVKRQIEEEQGFSHCDAILATKLQETVHLRVT